MEVENTKEKTKVFYNLNKPVPLHEYTKGKGKKATFKDMVLKDNIKGRREDNFNYYYSL